MGIYSTTAARGMWLITRYQAHQNWRHWAFSIYKRNRKISIGNFHLGIEECVPFVTSPIRSQAPLCRLDAFSKLFYYFLEQVFLRPFSAKQILIIGICGYGRLTSVSFHLSRFTGVETSPVNEELQKNFSELFMQHFKRKMCTGKTASNKQEFLPTTLIYGTFVLQ